MKDENFDWIGKNYDELAKRYGDRWIAVLDKKVIADDDSLEKLKKRVKEMVGERFDEVVFEFVTKKTMPDWDAG